MKKWDQGLGAIGLIALAAILTVLVTIGTPIAASKTTLELKDWLGFAGNIVGGIVTLIAAYVAWRAVQPQIAAQRDAVLLDVTTREEDRLESELSAIYIFEELYSAIIIDKPRDTYRYALAVHSEGITPSQSATCTALQAKVAGPIPPAMIGQLGHLYAMLSYWLNRLAEAEKPLTVAEANDAQPDPSDVQAVEYLRSEVEKREGDIHDVMNEFGARRLDIERYLLPACRRRIERGLGLLHD